MGNHLKYQNLVGIGTPCLRCTSKEFEKIGIPMNGPVLTEVRNKSRRVKSPSPQIIERIVSKIFIFNFKFTSDIMNFTTE